MKHEKAVKSYGIPDSEKRNYFDSLRQVFGKEICSDIEILEPQYQYEMEWKRHNVENACTESFIKIRNGDINKFLVLLTQNCLNSCRHCYMFCNNQAVQCLDLNRFTEWHGRQDLPNTDIVISGGNGYYNPRSLMKIMNINPSALFMPYEVFNKTDEQAISKMTTKREVLRLYISMDSFRSTKWNEVEIFLSKLRSLLFPCRLTFSIAINEKQDIDHYCQIFKKLGFQIQGLKKELKLYRTGLLFELLPHITFFADFFFVEPAGRAVTLFSNQKKVFVCVAETPAKLKKDVSLIINPDGDISVYDIFMIPPAVLNHGNIYIDSIENILKNISRDPIVSAVLSNKWQWINDFGESYYPAFFKKLFNKLSEPQAIYYFLLQPQRKFELNSYLRECWETYLAT